MGRLPKTNRVTRTRASNTWTEAAFFAFLRSGLRQLSMRWPPIRTVLFRVPRPYSGPNKRQKWEFKCEWCGNYFPRTGVQVDHIEPCGKLMKMEDIGDFARKLFCEEDGLQVLCRECHDWKR